MAIPVKQFFTQDDQGNIRPGALVTVRKEADNSLATLFSDKEGTIPKANPFSSDATGLARFYVALGVYRIKSSDGIFSNELRDVEIGSAGSSLATLSDVQLTGLSNGDILRWDIATGKFKNAKARELLTQSRAYYVSTTGSDSNNGLTLGSPFLTLAKAYAVVSSSIDFGGKDVLIQLADGTYPGGLHISGPWSGGGTLTIQGNASAAANVVINPGVFSAYGILNDATLPGVLTVKNMTFYCPGAAIFHRGVGTIKHSNIVFGTCGSSHLSTETPGAVIEAVGNVFIAGSAAVHMSSSRGGMIFCVSRNVFISGSPNFSVSYIYATRSSQVQAYANTYTGAATGTRFIVDLNSLIFANGEAQTTPPGSSPGLIISATGGIYA